VYLSKKQKGGGEYPENKKIQRIAFR